MNIRQTYATVRDVRACRAATADDICGGAAGYWHARLAGRDDDDRRAVSSAAAADVSGRDRLNAAQSKPSWPARVVPPKGAPNVLLIMTDDVGFGVPSTFGGVIPTPNLDRIAQDGLRYTNFHSTALCSPTRAALITGRNHHSVGFGVISEQATGYPGYNSIIAEGQGDDRQDPQGQRLRHVLVRQGPQHAGVPGEPGRAVRPVADRHGLRVLLRLRRRRHQPVAAEPVPQHHGDLSRTSASPAGT